MMDIEAIMEDLVITAEELETTQGLAVVEEISQEIKEAFSRILNSFMITRGGTT